MQTIERFARERRAAKRLLLIGVLGLICAAGATAYFFFPAAAKNVVRSAAAVVAQSWSDTFGAPPPGGGAPPLEIALAQDGSSTLEDGASVAGGAIGGAAEAGAGGTVAAMPPDATAVHESAAGTAPGAESDSVGENASSPQPAASAPPSTSTAAQSAAPPPTPPQPCSFAAASSRTPTRAVLINEIAWMGSRPLSGETASHAANREWIELRNTSGAALDIGGWQLEDAAGELDIVLGFDAGGNAARAAIPAAGFYLLERGGGPAASGTLPGAAAGAGYSGALPNSGGTLVLFDRACGVADRIDAADGWPGGDNGEKRTLERNADGYGWHTSAAAGGTPGAANSVPAAPAAAAVTDINTAATGGGGATENGASNIAETATSTADNGANATTTICIVVPVASTTATSTATTSTAFSNLVIAEIQIAGDASDNDFVKLFNPTPDAVDIGGWKLRKKSKTGAEYSLRVFPAGDVVAPGGYFVWANAGGGFGDAMGAGATSAETLAADNSAALFDATGAQVDAVAWGEGASQYVEGAAYPANPDANQALRRKFADGGIVDTDSNVDDFAL